MSGHGDINRLGMLRIDRDLGDALAVLEPHLRPVVAAVRRLVDAVAHRDAIARPRFPGAHPHRLGIRAIDGDRADRLVVLVEHWIERGAAILRLPYAAARRA